MYSRSCIDPVYQRDLRPPLCSSSIQHNRFHRTTGNTGYSIRFHLAIRVRSGVLHAGAAYYLQCVLLPRLPLATVRSLPHWLNAYSGSVTTPYTLNLPAVGLPG